MHLIRTTIDQLSDHLSLSHLHSSCRVLACAGRSKLGSANAYGGHAKTGSQDFCYHKDSSCTDLRVLKLQCLQINQWPLGLHKIFYIQSSKFLLILLSLTSSTTTCDITISNSFQVERYVCD